MTQKEIDKMFNGRWRFKSTGIMDIDAAVFNRVKKLCRDFFEAGLLIGEGFQVAEKQCKPTGQMIIFKHDPILDTADGGFSEWWEAYDKKRGREKCMKKWEKMTDEERRACISATPAYVASTPDKAYRKDPLTYLNGKCWNDEIIIKNGNKPSNDSRDKLADILAP